ncbi:MAG: potassium channel family protein, partial [Anaerolineales bacterium]
MGYKSGNGTETKSAGRTKETIMNPSVFFSVRPSYGAMRQKKLTRNNIILLICLLIMILFFPVLSFHRVLIKNILFTAIVFFGTFSLDFVKRAQKILIASGAVTICLTWLDYLFPSHELDFVNAFSFFFFNLFIVVFMIKHIAISKKVNLTIILNSINGYLLIGILGSVLLAMSEILQKFLYHLDTGAINFSGGPAQGFHDFLYFSFVTLTTLGYGDVTPVSAFAKSVTLIISVSGQLYLTILIAMLVGKFLSRTE